jgi:hypothetical protein
LLLGLGGGGGGGLGLAFGREPHRVLGSDRHAEHDEKETDAENGIVARQELRGIVLDREPAAGQEDRKKKTKNASREKFKVKTQKRNPNSTGKYIIPNTKTWNRLQNHAYHGAKIRAYPKKHVMTPTKYVSPPNWACIFASSSEYLPEPHGAIGPSRLPRTAVGTRNHTERNIQVD